MKWYRNNISADVCKEVVQLRLRKVVNTWIKIAWLFANKDLSVGNWSRSELHASARSIINETAAI